MTTDERGHLSQINHHPHHNAQTGMDTCGPIESTSAADSARMVSHPPSTPRQRLSPLCRLKLHHVCQQCRGACQYRDCRLPLSHRVRHTSGHYDQERGMCAAAVAEVGITTTNSHRREIE